MQTLLEFILAEYIGPPTRVVGNGESYWECPLCAHPKFHSMPVHPKFKHRAKCHKCGFIEDAAGLLQEFHSGAYHDRAALTNYSDRIELLENLEATWKAQQAKSVGTERGRGARSRSTKHARNH